MSSIFLTPGEVSSFTWMPKNFKSCMWCFNFECLYLKLQDLKFNSQMNSTPTTNHWVPYIRNQMGTKYKYNSYNGQSNMWSSHKGCNSPNTVGNVFLFVFLASCSSIFGRIDKYCQNCTKNWNDWDANLHNLFWIQKITIPRIQDITDDFQHASW